MPKRKSGSENEHSNLDSLLAAIAMNGQTTQPAAAAVEDPAIDGLPEAKTVAEAYVAEIAAQLLANLPEALPADEPSTPQAALSLFELANVSEETAEVDLLSPAEAILSAANVILDSDISLPAVDDDATEVDSSSEYEPNEKEIESDSDEEYVLSSNNKRKMIQASNKPAKKAQIFVPAIAEGSKSAIDILKADKESATPTQISQALAQVIMANDTANLQWILDNIVPEKIKAIATTNKLTFIHKLCLLHDDTTFKKTIQFLLKDSDSAYRSKLAHVVKASDINNMISRPYSQRIQFLFEKLPAISGLMAYTSPHYKKTFLHNAATYSKYTLIPLFAKFIDIDAKDNNGMTALHYAAKCTNQGIVALFEEGADYTLTDNNGLTAIEHIKAGPSAVYTKGLFEQQIKKRNSANYAPKKAKLTITIEDAEGKLPAISTPAPVVSEKPAVQINIAYGSKKKPKTSKNDDAAVPYHVQEFIDQLFGKKETITNQELTKAINMMIGASHEPILDMVLKNIDADKIKEAFLQKDKPSLLTRLCLVKNQAFFETMVNFLADNSDEAYKKELISQNFNEATLTQMFYKGLELVPRIQLLLKKFPDTKDFLTHLTGFNHKTYLHIAAQLNLYTLIPTLLKYFDKDLPDGYGQTALHHAAKSSALESVQCLLENKARNNIRDKNDKLPSDLVKYNDKGMNAAFAQFTDNVSPTAARKPKAPLLFRAKFDPIPMLSELAIIHLERDPIGNLVFVNNDQEERRLLDSISSSRVKV